MLKAVIVLVLLAATYVLDMPGWAQAVAYAVFIVVGWVSMWWAVETLLFDWLASRRRVKILTLIKNATLEVRPEF